MARRRPQRKYSTEDTPAWRRFIVPNHAAMIVSQLSGDFKFAEWASHYRHALYDGDTGWAENTAQNMEQAAELLTNLARICRDSELRDKAASGMATYAEVFGPVAAGSTVDEVAAS
jgi:hypothetical protein